MDKDKLDRRIKHILNEEETFLLSLILLAQLHDDEKYKNLSELIFLFDNYKGFKQFIKFFGGTDIHVPSDLELKQALRLLELFQKTKIDKKDFDECYSLFRFSELNLSKEYCKLELEKFEKYLTKNGNITLKSMKKLNKGLK